MREFGKNREYLLPNLEQVINLLDTILFSPKQLQKFNDYYQETKHIRDIIVLYPYKSRFSLRSFWYSHLSKTSLKNMQARADNIRVWQSSHFGGHQFAPTLIDLPTGRLWGHLED